MPHAWSRNAPQGRSATTPDARAARLAAGQWGVVTHDELRECGLSAKAIRTRVARGIMHPLWLRTVIDLARVEGDDVVKRALRAAKFSAAELEQLPRRILDLGAVPTRSPLEDSAYDLVRRLGLELPLSNPP